jgi:hypothetical protein
MRYTASNILQNQGVVMPIVSNVIAGVVYGWPDTRTGTGTLGPDAPVITNVVDNLDQDSVTVSLTGTDTLQLYYRQKGVSAWTTGLTRLGSGDIIQTGLLPGTWYEIYATAFDGFHSDPSNLVTVFLSQAEGVGTLKTAIYTILMGDINVQSIVDGRVSPGGDPMRGKSSIVYHLISSITGHTMDGPDTLTSPTLQVNSYGSRDFIAEQLSDLVRTALDGFSGTVNGVSISYIALQDEGDLEDYEPENKEISRHGIRQDYLVTYTEN